MIKCFICNRKVVNGIWIKKFNGLVKVHYACDGKMDYKVAVAAIKECGVNK